MKVYVVTDADRHVVGVVSNASLINFPGQKGIKVYERQLDCIPMIPEGETAWCVMIEQGSRADHINTKVWPIIIGFEGEKTILIDESTANYECIVTAGSAINATIKALQRVRNAHQSHSSS